MATASIDGGTPIEFDAYSATRAQNALFWTSPALAKSTHILKVNLIGRQNPSSGGTVVPVDKVVITQSAGGTALVQLPRKRQNAMLMQGNPLAQMTIVNSRGTVVGTYSQSEATQVLSTMNGQSAGVYFAVIANGQKIKMQPLIKIQK